MADVAIVGGGLAGLATAHHLAPHARVVVLDQGEQPGSEASAQNAGMVRRLDPDPYLRALAIRTAAWMADPGDWPGAPPAPHRGGGPRPGLRPPPPHRRGGPPAGSGDRGRRPRHRRDCRRPRRRRVPPGAGLVAARRAGGGPLGPDRGLRRHREGPRRGDPVPGDGDGAGDRAGSGGGGRHRRGSDPSGQRHPGGGGLVSAPGGSAGDRASAGAPEADPAAIRPPPPFPPRSPLGLGRRRRPLRSARGRWMAGVGVRRGSRGRPRGPRDPRGGRSRAPRPRRHQARSIPAPPWQPSGSRGGGPGCAPSRRIGGRSSAPIRICGACGGPRAWGDRG